MLEEGRRSAAGAGSVFAFDLGVAAVAALVAAALPEPSRAIGLLSPSGIVVVAAVVGAALPYSLLVLHGEVARAPGNTTYRRAVAFAIRLVGTASVLGMWFALPFFLGRSGLVSERLDDLLFVVGTLAALAGAVAGFGSVGAGLAIAAGAALLGAAFTLPGDIAGWLGGGRRPVVGIVGAAALIALVAFVGRFVGRLDEIADVVDRWRARPAGRRLARLGGPFLLAVALAWWNALYAGAIAASLDRGTALLALVALGVVPYRLLRALAPPVRPVPMLAGLAALCASLWSLLGR